MSSNKSKVVCCIDMGSLNVRAGFAGDDKPCKTMRSVVGYPKYKPALYGFSTSSFHVGDEAVRRRGVLDYCPILHHGCCKNFDLFETMYGFMFENELQVDSRECSLVLTDSVLGPHSHREKTAQVLFETFEICELYCGWKSIMAFYGIGRSSCLSVCVGDGVTQIVPIVDGRAILESARRLNFGGRNITKYLKKLLTQRGYYFENSSTEQDILRDIKETCGYTSLNIENDLKQVSLYGSKPKLYTLPDGNSLTLGKELFQCNEAWFNPTLVRKEYPGLALLIFDCIQSMAIDVRRQMYENICLSGAATFTEGFIERLQCEIQKLVPESNKCKIVAGSKRQDNAWLGCSVLGSMSNSFHNGMSMTREEYDEYGPLYVHRKFIE